MAGAVAGLLVGTLLAGVLAARDVAASHPDRDRVAVAGPVATRQADVDAFARAWQRSRTGTWVVRLAFTRRTAAGGRIDDEIRIAQRPPDRLIVGPLGAVAGRIGDRTVNCGTGATGALRCAGDQPVLPYADEAAREVATLRSYFAGRSPLYTLEHDGDCFTLRLRRRYPSPPYGDRARFCFDRATGAPTRREVHRREGTDVQRAVEVRGEVSADDLRLPVAAG
jgi:hypothetical protein